MAPNYLTSNGRIHLSRGLRLAPGPKTTDNLVEIGFRKTVGGTQQNSIADIFHRELGARPPGSGGPYILGQNDLTFRGEPRSFHQ
jgi:hypothetical protein